MEHKEVRLLLDEYHDGELSPATSSGVRDHLKACPECGAAIAGREYLAQVLSDAVNIPPSEEFVRGVLGRLTKSRVEPASLRWPLPAMAVALAASVFIVVGLFSHTPPENNGRGLISAKFEYEQGGPMPVMEQEMEISSHDQVLGSLLEES